MEYAENYWNSIPFLLRFPKRLAITRGAPLDEQQTAPQSLQGAGVRGWEATRERKQGTGRPPVYGRRAPSYGRRRYGGAQRGGPTARAATPPPRPGTRVLCARSRFPASRPLLHESTAAAAPIPPRLINGWKWDADTGSHGLRVQLHAHEHTHTHIHMHAFVYLSIYIYTYI